MFSQKDHESTFALIQIPTQEFYEKLKPELTTEGYYKITKELVTRHINDIFGKKLKPAQLYNTLQDCQKATLTIHQSKYILLFIIEFDLPLHQVKQLLSAKHRDRDYRDLSEKILNLHSIPGFNGHEPGEDQVLDLESEPGKSSTELSEQGFFKSSSSDKIKPNARVDNNDIGTAQDQHKGKSQEDAIAFSNGMKLEPLHDVPAALTSTVAEMQKRHGQEGVGSTLSAAVIDGRTIYTAYVGDSPIFLVTYDADFKNPTIELLSQPLHTPKYQKQLNPKVWVLQGRLGGELALGRAIGDNQLEECGLSHEPDIHTYQLPAGREGFIIVASDGLTNCGDLENTYTTGITSDTIKETLMNGLCAKKDSQQIAEALLKAAKPETTDNISVLVAEVSGQKCLAVFDGHGGAVVSNDMAQNFLPTLNNQLQQQLVDQHTQKPVDRVPPVPARSSNSNCCLM